MNFLICELSFTYPAKIKLAIRLKRKRIIFNDDHQLIVFSSKSITFTNDLLYWYRFVQANETSCYFIHISSNRMLQTFDPITINDLIQFSLIFQIITARII